MAEIITRQERLSSTISKILTASNKSAVKEEIALGWLDTERVCILTKTKIQVGETWHIVGNEIRKDYENTEENKGEITANVPEPYLSAILAVWSKGISE